MVRADMESAHGAPIATSGRHAVVGRVIGVKPCECDPVCHDGRSVSLQTGGGFDQYGFVVFISAMNGKHVLGEINSSSHNAHGLSLSWILNG